MNETMHTLFGSRDLMPSSLTPGALTPAPSNHMAAQVNQALARNGLHLSEQEIATLQEERAIILAETERIECGPGALPLIASTMAPSPFVFQENLAEILACIQHLFYQIRDEVPVDVPDEELAEALRVRFDQLEGDLDELEALSAQAVLASLPETAHAQSQNQEAARMRVLQREYEADGYWPQAANCENLGDAYCICDENGREYVFRPASTYETAGMYEAASLFFAHDGITLEEWDYDEFADGWDGEKWGDDLD